MQLVDLVARNIKSSRPRLINPCRCVSRHIQLLRWCDMALAGQSSLGAPRFGLNIGRCMPGVDCRVPCYFLKGVECAEFEAKSSTSFLALHKKSSHVKAGLADWNRRRSQSDRQGAQRQRENSQFLEASLYCESFILFFVQRVTGHLQRVKSSDLFEYQSRCPS